jgi:hypothetical protein
MHRCHAGPSSVAEEQQAWDVREGELNFDRHLGQDRVRGTTGKKMQHALLLNPFSLNPEQAQIVNRPKRIVNRQSARSTPVCARCESDDILSYVTAQWSNESQQWELADTFDQPAHCNKCDGACEITWLPL